MRSEEKKKEVFYYQVEKVIINKELLNLNLKSFVHIHARKTNKFPVFSHGIYAL